MHIAVAPSVPTADGRREGIPVVLMEAAACGLPLVASRLSGIPELVHDGETGYLAEPGDVEGLANAINKLARTPSLCRRLGDAARHRLEADFNLLTNVARLQRLMLPEVMV
jgi:glycosyltransferase involved in cell wall biosynthesis